jgi:hypothetical protein
MADSAATEYLRSLLKRRELYQQGAVAELQEFFKRRDRRPPEEFHDSSFLYIRSHDNDVGLRPFSGIVHWHSPDITLSPLTNVAAYTTTLEAGESYVIRCALRNRGDIGVPSAKVELFLTDPSLGFDTRFATNLTLGRVPSAWVPSSASAAVEFVYNVPPNEAGHKCLFARTFSFSPLDVPIDDFQLDPRLDRHVAQQNLNIIGQSQSYGFAMVHAPNARVRINLRPLEPEQLLALRHPVLGDVTPAREFPRREWGRLTRLELRKAAAEDFVVRETPEGLVFHTQDPNALSLDAQRELNLAVRKVLASVNAGNTKMAAHRELFGRFRRMNSQARRSTFALTTPDLRLQPREAVGLEITSLDENGPSPEVFGGIILIIVGR